MQWVSSWYINHTRWDILTVLVVDVEFILTGASTGRAPDPPPRQAGQFFLFWAYKCAKIGSLTPMEIQNIHLWPTLEKILATPFKDAELYEGCWITWMLEWMMLNCITYVWFVWRVLNLYEHVFVFVWTILNLYKGCTFCINDCEFACRMLNIHEGCWI